jgi:sulfoxide reductase heme-binding subunit YedZ
VSRTDALGHVWWLAGRSAGIVAYVLLSLSVILGVSMATGVLPGRMRPALRTLHERVALLALGAIAGHGLLILADSWLHPGVAGILVPFTMAYRPVWTGLGILGGYLTALLSLGYYARRTFGPKRWRAAHRFIPIAWALAAVHALGAGTDGGTVWLRAILAATAVTVLGLLAARWGRSGGRRRAPRAAPGRPTARRPEPGAARPTPERPVAGTPAPAAARVASSRPPSRRAPRPVAREPLWAPREERS